MRREWTACMTDMMICMTRDTFNNRTHDFYVMPVFRMTGMTPEARNPKSIVFCRGFVYHINNKKTDQISAAKQAINKEVRNDRS